MVVVPAAGAEALAEHARQELPNESCGLLVLRDRVADRYEPGRNAAESPYRFELEVDPEPWFLEDDGYELAVVHSHVSAAASPVAHRRRERRALAGPPVPHLLGRARRARSLDDRRQA